MFPVHQKINTPLLSAPGALSSKTIDQVNATIPIKNYNLISPFVKKDLLFPLINIPTRRANNIKRHESERNVPDSSLQRSLLSNPLFLGKKHVNVTYWSFTPSKLIWKKKKNGGWNTLGTRKLGRPRAKRERERERDSFSSTMQTLCVQEASAKDDGRPLDSPCFNRDRAFELAGWPSRDKTPLDMDVPGEKKKEGDYWWIICGMRIKILNGLG